MGERGYHHQHQHKGKKEKEYLCKVRPISKREKQLGLKKELQEEKKGKERMEEKIDVSDEQERGR